MGIPQLILNSLVSGICSGGAVFWIREVNRKDGLSILMNGVWSGEDGDLTTSHTQPYVIRSCSKCNRGAVEGVLVERRRGPPLD